MFTPSRITFAAVLSAAVLAAPAISAGADETKTPFERDVPRLESGPRKAHRLLSVHALHLPLDAAEPKKLQIGARGPLPKIAQRGTDLTATIAKDAEPTLLLPGRVISGPEEDYAVATHTLLPAGESIELTLSRSSDDGKRRDPSVRAALLPPAMLWHVLHEPRDTEARETAQMWARLTDAKGDRESPLDVRESPRLKKRADDYVRSLTALPPTPVGRRLVGWAVFMDGRLCTLEVSTEAASLIPLWNATLSGLATEAAFLELNDELISEEKADVSATLKAERRWLRRTLKRMKAVRPAREKLAKTGTRFRARLASGLLRGVEWQDSLAHLVLITDPAGREVPGMDTVEPGAAVRQGATTKEEERVIERR